MLRVVSRTEVLAKPRPSSYWSELAACAVDEGPHHLTIDFHGAAFADLVSRYRGYIPTADDHDRARPHLAKLAETADAIRSRGECPWCEMGKVITRELIPYDVATTTTSHREATCT